MTLRKSESLDNDLHEILEETILDIFSLDASLISYNPLKKAFATIQPAFLSNSIAFYDIFARAPAERFCFLILFFRLVLFLLFCNLFAAFVDLGLFPVQEFLRKHHRH